MRTGQDRNTVNLGLGYRQYLNDWMLGINTFYDYDYTGKNKRLGVGAEAWRDYLKLAVNGYHRLTDWHQSVLSAMEDYDERPANGFDLREEGYLPAWPNLGGTLKYEQYFGKGVSLSNSPSVDNLKDNPKALTAGVTYTPFPLMTLSASQSVGDTNDSRVGLDLTYRFGVPWHRQVSPDSVDLMRSLAGSRYNFVDRNYEIVMQYRKQTLLKISLPERQRAQASETMLVSLTVLKAKYGIKTVSWNVDPLLTERGGRFQQISPTEVQVTLPAYIFGQKTYTAQNYKISAVATDNNGNQSNTAETLIGVVPSENSVSSLTISPNDKSLPVNASKGYTITGGVTDGNGAALANQSVTFSLDGLADANGQPGATLSSPDGKLTDSSKITVTTLADGKATVLLRSRVAGQGTVTATMDNGNANSGKVSFVADATTAALTALVVKDDNAKADGKATNSVSITVKDKFGNPVNGAEVYLTASNEAKIADKVSTNEQGSAKVTLTSTKAGPSTVVASLNDSQKEVNVTFGVGKPAQDASGIKTDKSDYTAGDEITVSVVLKDEENIGIRDKSALLTDSAVTVPNAFAKSGSKWVEDTQSPGTYTRLYIAKTASENQRATLNLTGWSKTSNAYSIKVNINKAAVMSIEAKDNNAVADGTAKNSVLVTVKDNYENRVNGAVVLFEASNGALIAESATTDPEGTVLVTLTNAKAGVSKVTASLNSSRQSVDVSFGVGQPVKATSFIATNKATYILASDIRVEIALRDQNQNAVTGLDSTKLSSMVTVANAEEKSAVNWVENSNTGTYVGTYVAKISGENLTATLKVSDGINTSDAYSIIAGGAVLANSTITRNSDSYVSGKDIRVTATLKDGDSPPNPVTGLASATLSSMVSVANAEAKSASNWTEVADEPGTYTGDYVAKAVGMGLGATLSIAGASKTSAAYAVTPGEAVHTGSGIATNAASYVAGAEMLVKVTLKDGQGNGVTGQKDALTSSTVTVANATAKAESGWADNNDGTYSRTYIANAMGSSLKATLHLSGWSTAAESAAYAITQGAENGDESSLSISAARIVANDNATSTAGTDNATITLNVLDAYKNGITGIKDNIKFIVSDSRGSTVNSGVTVDDISESSDTAGKYTARVYGNATDTYTITVKVNNVLLGNLSKELTLYSYTFALNTVSKSVIVNGTYQFIVKATPTDTKVAEELSSGVSWTSGDTGVATVANTGIAKAVGTGTTKITATGTYKGVAYDKLTAELTVKGNIESPVYGTSRSGDTSNTYIIEPPSYSLSIRSGSLIDAVGTTEGLTGGTGGTLKTIKDVNKVRSIGITVGTWEGAPDGPHLAQLVFNMSDGSSTISGNLRGYLILREVHLLFLMAIFSKGLSLVVVDIYVPLNS